MTTIFIQRPDGITGEPPQTKEMVVLASAKDWGNTYIVFNGLGRPVAMFEREWDAADFMLSKENYFIGTAPGGSE